MLADDLFDNITEVVLRLPCYYVPCHYFGTTKIIATNAWTATVNFFSLKFLSSVSTHKLYRNLPFSKQKNYKTMTRPATEDVFDGGIPSCTLSSKRQLPSPLLIPAAVFSSTVSRSGSQAIQGRVQTSVESQDSSVPTPARGLSTVSLISIALQIVEDEISEQL